MSTALPIVVMSFATLMLLALIFGGLATVSHVVHAFAGRVFQMLILSIAAFSVIQTLLSGRVLRLGDAGLERLAGGDMADFFLGKVMLALIIGVSIAICVAWALWGLAEKRPPARYTAAGIAQLNRLTWAFLIYYVAFSLLPLAGAPQFAFHISLVYPFFVWLALLLAWRSSMPDPVHVIRQGMGLIVLASLVAAVLMPSLALQPGYRGVIPGFNMRLWGVTTGPNTMGSVASMLLVLQFVERPRSPVRHHLVTLAAVIALVLSQSKASIGAAMLATAILAVWRVLYGSSDRPGKNRDRAVKGIILLVLVGAALTAALWFVATHPPVIRAVEQRLNPDAVESLSTATGRIDIWKHAIQQGLESPVFGQGISIWSQQARAAMGLSGASNAHNLYLQTFSVAGSIGLLPLLVLLALIVSFAVSAGTVSRGGSLALLFVFFTRSFFEVAFSPNAIIGAEFFAFITTVVFATDRGLLARGELRWHSPYSENVRTVTRVTRQNMTLSAAPNRSNSVV